MKKLIPILMILFISSCKKEEVNPSLTKEFCIQSSYANATYNIKVGYPKNYDSNQKYATMYVLDGNENFSFVAENAHAISNDISTSNLLVVAICNGNDRAMDYTPTNVNEGDGGADNFMHFIKDELIPRIESEFNADTLRSSRIILGHSFGGLLASYAFTNFNEVFGNYLILSPSIWYDNEIMLRLEEQNRNLNNNKHQLIFMSLGELEKSGRMLAPYMAFYQRLKNNYPDIKITSSIEPHLGHSGSKNPGIKKALSFYFQNR